jgi:hypothetical protein
MEGIRTQANVVRPLFGLYRVLAVAPRDAEDHLLVVVLALALVVVLVVVGINLPGPNRSALHPTDTRKHMRTYTNVVCCNHKLILPHDRPANNSNTTPTNSTNSTSNIRSIHTRSSTSSSTSTRTSTTSNSSSSSSSSNSSSRAKLAMSLLAPISITLLTPLLALSKVPGVVLTLSVWPVQGQTS